MKDYTVKSNNYGSYYIIKGENLIDAITNNFSKIADDSHLGNAAGFKLIKVTAQNKQGILGGKGGVELVIVHKGMPLANNLPVNRQEIATVWIDTDEKIDHEFEIG